MSDPVPVGGSTCNEGLKLYRLFLFEVDQHASPVSVKVEEFYPIKGSFSSEVRGEPQLLVKGSFTPPNPFTVSKPAWCQVLLNNGIGSSIALELSYDSHTAVFISQLNKALHQFSKWQAATYVYTCTSAYIYSSVS